jgi:UDP-N-acetylglucosamine 2-epimerase (non-hydrolysing)
MEAGNRCFDQRVPEETNRKIVDHISDINLTYSDIAREYLLREGIPADTIIKTGSPMFEVLNYYHSKILASDVLTRLKLDKEKFFVISCHREENINDKKNFEGLIACLNLLADSFNMPVIVSTHPRTRKMIESGNFKMNEKVRFLKPLSFSDYNALQLNAFVVLSDSGTISEESSILNFPALNIREAHERPEAMEEAAVMMVGLNSERIIQGISQLQSQKRNPERNFFLVQDYSKSNVSDKVVRIILSYTDYILHNTWKGSDSLQ